MPSVVAPLSAAALPISGSAYGCPQPPCSKPPRRSSSGRPGAWTTPSRVRLMNTTILRIRASLTWRGIVPPPNLNTNGFGPNRHEAKRLAHRLHGGLGAIGHLRSHDQDWSLRVCRQVGRGRTQEQVVQRAVAVAPDNDEVGAALVRHLDDLFAGASRPNHHLPVDAGAAESAYRLLPDPRLLIVEGLDHRGVGEAGRHQGRSGQVPHVDDHDLGSNAGSQVRHLFEASAAGRRSVRGYHDPLDPPRAPVSVRRFTSVHLVTS